MTSEPTMGAQVPSVITLRTSGLALPCSVTMLAIWITGSFSASGKQPCQGLRRWPDHFITEQFLQGSLGLQASHALAFALLFFVLCSDMYRLSLLPHESAMQGRKCPIAALQGDQRLTLNQNVGSKLVAVM